jgi:hypothetical protein
VFNRRSEVKPVVGFLGRLSVNYEIIHNAYLCLPVENDHAEFVQLGHGQVTNPNYCAAHTSWHVCDDLASHDGVLYKGELYSGKLAVSHGINYCHSLDCPRCFLGGYVNRTARAIAGKMRAGVKRGYGDVEHFTVTFSKKDWDLPEAVLRKKAEAGSLRRGIMGAAFMFHGRRIRRGRSSLMWSPHYHGIGFVLGTYNICRDCPYLGVSKTRTWCTNEAECVGFEQRTREAYQVDGLIVKVFAKRSSGKTMEESVIKTARYILSHATHRVGIKKSYVVSYFGACANKRLKSEKIKPEYVCEVCASVGVHNVMKRKAHWGKERLVTDIGSPLFRKVFPSGEFDDLGLPLWVDYGGGVRDG